MAEQVTNLGQAVNILVQVATLAQSKGILTLAEAVVVKESIDFIAKLQEPTTENLPPVQTEENIEEVIKESPKVKKTK